MIPAIRIAGRVPRWNNALETGNLTDTLVEDLNNFAFVGGSYPAMMLFLAAGLSTLITFRPSAAKRLHSTKTRHYSGTADFRDRWYSSPRLSLTQKKASPR